MKYKNRPNLHNTHFSPLCLFSPKPPRTALGRTVLVVILVSLLQSSFQPAPSFDFRLDLDKRVISIFYNRTMISAFFLFFQHCFRWWYNFSLVSCLDDTQANGMVHITLLPCPRTRFLVAICFRNVFLLLWQGLLSRRFYLQLVRLIIVYLHPLTINFLVMPIPRHSSWSKGLQSLLFLGRSQNSPFSAHASAFP